MDMDISTNPFKEILILIMGPLAQIVCYTILTKIGNHISLLKYYHYGILFFNLLPIIPLDGGRLLNIIISSFLPYKITLYTSIFLSYFMAILILFMNNTVSINMILTYIILILLIHKEELKITIHFNKFILERLLKKYKFKKKSFIHKEENMYRYHQNMFKYNNKWIDEKEYLKRKYLT